MRLVSNVAAVYLQARAALNFPNPVKEILL